MSPAASLAPPRLAPAPAGPPALATYYQQRYQAQPVPAAGSYPAPPARARVAGVPAISYANAYCQTASLQMLDRDPARAATDVHAYNWLTGFTYGAYVEQDVASFLPYTDPEVGFQPAVRELGLARHYYVTSDEAAFGLYLKHLLASGQPVRVALNGHALLGRPGFFPHAVVVVGYEADDILYHETGVRDRYEAAPAGERTPLARLAQAVAQMQAVYHYPWRYNLTVLAPGPLAAPAAARRNGQALAGWATPGASTGAQALRTLARLVLAGPVAPATWQQAHFRFAAGVYTRRDNAAFLRREPLAGRQLAPAAAWFEASADHFAGVVAELDQPGAVRQTLVADHLLAAAALEERVAHHLLGA
jgi:hypothetical protein